VLRAGVIGAGWVAADRHIPSLQRATGVELVGIFDSKIERAERSATDGVLITDDLDRFYDLELDLVSICTSPWSHTEYALDAAHRGVHVFCEKPTALTPSDATAMFDAADAAGRMLCVSHNFLWSNAMTRARAALASAGDIHYVGGVQLSSDARRLPTWHHDLRGGLLFDEIPHMLYILEDLLGSGLEVDHVRAVWADRSSEPQSCEVLLRGNAGPAQLAMVFGAPLSEWHVSTVAEKSVIDVDLFRDVMISTGSDGGHTAKEVLGTSARIVGQHLSGFAAAGARVARKRQFWGHDSLVQAVIDAIHCGSPSPVPRDRALSVVHATEAILSELDGNRPH
jgi:scyllo-inositol 2-dehydrogenase (NADP+)